MKSSIVYTAKPFKVRHC